VTCLEVRDLLPELALGVLPSKDRDRVERHLQWCAGCRKEASDLGAAAASLAYALEPAPVPRDLADRVLARVRRSAGAPGAPRRARTAVATIVAALIALSGLGWGAVMAGRAERFADRAERAERERSQALERFQRVLANVIPTEQQVPSDETYLGQLQAAAGSVGGGAALQLVSPRMPDFSMVIVSGLSEEGLPYRVRLVDARGEVLRAGRISELDADGGAEVFHGFDAADLTGYSTAQVLDAAGRVVLSGTIDRTP
jgi:hypothetical protein